MMRLKPISKIIIGISSIFLIIAIYNLATSILLQISGIEANGTVYDFKFDKEGLSKDYWTYFFTEKGDSVTFKNSFHYFWDNRYQKGEKVNILYLPGHNSLVKINTTSEMFGNLFLYLMLFIIFTLLGILFSVYEKIFSETGELDNY